MGDALEFAVKPRTILGKAVKKLRKQKQVPANVISASGESTPIVFSEIEFKRLYDKAGDTSLVYVNVEGDKSKKPTLIDEVQSDSISGQITHVVFRQVNLKEKIKAEVEISLVGESDVPNTFVLLVHDKVEVEALPTDLPDKFELDVSGLKEIGQMITFAQLPYDKSKVELQMSEEELESPVVMLQEVKEEVEEAPVEVTEGAGEAGEAKPEATEAEPEAAKE